MSQVLNLNQTMCCYAAEDAQNAFSVKVYAPDAFPDQEQGSATVETEFLDGENDFINAVPPSLSESIKVKNYINLPVLKKNDNDPGLSCSTDDKLLVIFIDNHPARGCVLGVIPEL